MKGLTVFLFALFVIGGLAVGSSKVIHAQAGFSDASLSGTYVFHFAGNGSTVINFPVPADPSAPNPSVTFPIPTPKGGIGEIQADGAGNITAGSGTLFKSDLIETPGSPLGFPPTFSVVDETCDATLTGTYSINPDGSGTMSLTPITLTPSGSGSCDSSGGTRTFDLKLAGQGKVGVFVSIKPNSGGDFAKIISGSFAKK